MIFGSRYSVFWGTSLPRELKTTERAVNGQPDYFSPQLIRSYEDAFAKEVGLENGYSFGTGRMALYSVLKAMGISEGDEVVIPAFTCVVVPNAILYCGAKPVYVDIDPTTFNIDVSKLEEKITDKTKVLYAQHTFGLTCEMRKIHELAHKYDLKVVEDCAHSLGATWEGQPTGSLGDASFFSTDHTKIINTYAGGMAFAKNPEVSDSIERVYEKAGFLPEPKIKSQLRSFELEQKFLAPNLFKLFYPFVAVHRKFVTNVFRDELETTKPTDYPFPCRLPAPFAEVGLSQLQNLKANLSHRRKIAQLLEDALGWYGLGRSDIEQGAWLRYSFLVHDRKEFVSRFKSKFHLGVWFTSIVQGRVNNLEAVGYVSGSCPVAEEVARRIVNFPTTQGIPLELIQEIIDRDGDWIRQRIHRIEGSHD